MNLFDEMLDEIVRLAQLVGACRLALVIRGEETMPADVLKTRIYLVLAVEAMKAGDTVAMLKLLPELRTVKGEL